MAFGSFNPLMSGQVSQRRSPNSPNHSNRFNPLMSGQVSQLLRGEVVARDVESFNPLMSGQVSQLV